MLSIGQSVYTVCKFYRTRDCIEIYVSQKDIVGINLDSRGTIVYTAGKYRELNFIEVSEGVYQSVRGQRTKAVYLTEREAYVEMGASLGNEKLKKEDKKNG